MRFGNIGRGAVFLLIGSLLAQTPAAAEVMDKEPTLALIWIRTSLSIFLALLLSRWKVWLSLLIWVPSALAGAALLSELYDPYVGPAILREAGQSYVVQGHIASVVLIGGPLAIFIWGMRGRARASPIRNDT